MHATFVTLWLQVMQPLANVHETKWTPHVERESDLAVHIIAVALAHSRRRRPFISISNYDSCITKLRNLYY